MASVFLLAVNSLIVLKWTQVLYQLFKIIDNFWYLHQLSFKMSKDTCNLSFFLLCSALLHSRLTARVVSFNHSSDWGLDGRILYGATVSRMFWQVEWNREVNSSVLNHGDPEWVSAACLKAAENCTAVDGLNKQQRREGLDDMTGERGLK